MSYVVIGNVEETNKSNDVVVFRFDDPNSKVNDEISALILTKGIIMDEVALRKHIHVFKRFGMGIYDYKFLGVFEKLDDKAWGEIKNNENKDEFELRRMYAKKYF